MKIKYESTDSALTIFDIGYGSEDTTFANLVLEKTESWESIIND